MEEYWCNYGVNPGYARPLALAGLVVSGRGEDGEIRIVELADHPFYVATLFLPQRRSAPGRPHPILAGFAAAVSRRRQGAARAGSPSAGRASSSAEGRP